MYRLTRYEKKALIFLIITSLVGTAVLIYKKIGSRNEIYVTKRPFSFRQSQPAFNAEGKLIDINTASTQELVTLPGIGAKLAQRIVEERARRGSFKWIDELKDIEGIGEAKFDKIKDKITLR